MIESLPALPRPVRTLEHLLSRPLPPALLLALLVGVLPGCDTAGPPTHEPRYVVESYQVAGEPLAPVRLMRTVPVGRSFDARDDGVAGARVRVDLLAEGGSAARTYAYRPDPSTRGRYLPEDPDSVRPFRTYRLRVEIPDAETSLRARTTIPDTFRVLAGAPDTVTYRDGAHVPLPASKSRYPERRAIYLLNTRTAEPSLDRLTPTGRELVAGLESLSAFRDREDEGYTVGSLAGNEWPLTNAASYPSRSAGGRTITYPWEAVLFFGANRIEVHTVGDDLYDFIRTISVQKQGAGPAGYTNVIDHVRGGTGVFGGLARATHRVYVRRPE